MNLVTETEVTSKVNETARRAVVQGDADFDQLEEVYRCNQTAFTLSLRGLSGTVLVDNYTAQYPSQDLFNVSKEYEC
jgi:hypothetical protein